MTSLTIRSSEALAIATRLAKLQGTTIAEAVLHALKEELQRQEHRADEVARMEVFSRRLSRLPALDHRSEDEILGYDSESKSPA
jgi:antitoxin VapB